MTRRLSGPRLVCAQLEALGVRVVFGLPGTQNVALFSALRESRLHTVVATSELAAGMMACGYARTSGTPGVLMTIPGPGFAYALPALAEARHDSVPLVLVTSTPAEGPGSAFRLQAVDQAAMAGPVCKATLRATAAGELAPAVREAVTVAVRGEPGPVLLELGPEALAGFAAAPVAVSAGEPEAPQEELVRRLVRELGSADRILLYVGQGAAGAPGALASFAERLGAPVVATTSARGVLPEDHPLSLPFDPVGGGIEELNALVARCDLVLVLGCKLAHNGSAGFRLRLPEERLVHIDADRAVPGANYPARLTGVCDVPALLTALAASSLQPRRGWPDGELARARSALVAARPGGAPEPRFPDLVPDDTASFFGALRRCLPRDAVVATDSGLHQYLVRRHLPVLSPRGLLTPTDFQAMGFGLPAAVGAALAAPERRVVAIVGDGGLAVAPLELATAAREGIRLTVVVLADGRYGLIRREQLGRAAFAFGTDLPAVDLEAIARAAGVGYVRLVGELEPSLARALEAPGVTLVEARIDDGHAVRRARRRGAARGLRDAALRCARRRP